MSSVAAKYASNSVFKSFKLPESQGMESTVAYQYQLLMVLVPSSCVVQERLAEDPSQFAFKVSISTCLSISN